MRSLAALLVACLSLASCVANDAPIRTVDLPPMRVPPTLVSPPPSLSNADIARDFMRLSFQLESGRELPVFTRFERPVRVRVRGSGPVTLDGDLAALLSRLRSEGGIDITRVPGDAEAEVTISLIPRDDLRRAVPGAACFVVPRVATWAEFLDRRRTPYTDWTTLTERDSLSVFLPADVSPQELRDCLHEELAQALGPLNDLYELPNSVFNDDNFHTTLTGFDMLVLRATYDPALRSGMTRDQVAERLPGILDRLNPAGRSAVAGPPRAPTRRDWISAIQVALGDAGSARRRIEAAQAAIGIAEANGWNDNRLAFSLFALGRLQIDDAPEDALGAFLAAADIYADDPETRLHAAHVAMQLAAFALSSGRAEQAIAIVDANLPPVEEAGNASLLATLLLIKAESLQSQGRIAQAAGIRGQALGWARYGYGDDAEVVRRAAAVAALAPRLGGGS